jgi:hypothetical protein
MAAMQFRTFARLIGSAAIQGLWLCAVLRLSVSPFRQDNFAQEEPMKRIYLTYKGEWLNLPTKLVDGCARCPSKQAVTFDKDKLPMCKRCAAVVNQQTKKGTNGQ